MLRIRNRKAGWHRAGVLALALVAIIGAVASAAPASAAGLTVSPLTIAFGNVVFGVTGATSAAHTVTITDPVSGSPISSLSIQLSGTNPGDFQISNNTCGTTLTPGTNCTLKVTFTPTALGARGAQLAINDSANSNAGAVTLSGTGIAGKLSITPLTLSFGNIVVGATSAVKTTTLRNPNTVALHIDTATLSGEFSITSDGCSGNDLAAAATCAIETVFSPTQTGTQNGNLTITDDAAGSPQSATLTGTGILANPTFSPLSLAFGKVQVGSVSAAKSLTITNPNILPLNIVSIGTAAPFDVVGNTCGSSIAAGGNCQVSVTFNPTTDSNPAGTTQTGKLIVADNAKTASQSVNLSGTAFGAVPTATATATATATDTATATATSTATATATATDTATATATNTSTATATATNTATATATDTATPTASSTATATATDTATSTATATATATDTATSTATATATDTATATATATDTATATATATDTPTPTATATASPTSTATSTATPTATATAVQYFLVGTAVQNGMNGAAITAVSVNPDGSDHSVLANTTTNSSGNFSVSINIPPNSPVRLRASGGTYVSEQNGATISAPSALSVLLPSVSVGIVNLQITPLTTFVDSLAQGNISRGEDLATAASNATASIDQYYGISSDPSFLRPLYTSAAIGTDAGRLGLILGALVNEDQLFCKSPNVPGGLVAALASDISDGVFDGMNSGSAISYCGDNNLPAIAGTAQFGDALSGMQGLALGTSGFTFGGTNNSLTLNSLTAAQVVAEATTIESAVVTAAPPSIDTFAATTPLMNTARDAATATLLPKPNFLNGQVLIAGGQNNFVPIASTELYDTLSNVFATSAPSMNVARSGATATLLPNGKVLIAGGEGSVAALKSVELYDPATGFAATTPSMNSARSLATATLLPNGMVLIAGGSLLSSTELYNPVTNTFAPAASTPVMNGGRSFATATLLPNGKVLIAGGAANMSSTGALATTELYDPVANTFAASTPVMNAARYVATATLLANGKVLIAGGTRDGNTGLSSTELYDPVANTFAPSTPAMNAARAGATATLLPNGKVLIAGGVSFDVGYLSSTELYDPVATLSLPQRRT
jgi:hypothetical protein